MFYGRLNDRGGDPSSENLIKFYPKSLFGVRYPAERAISLNVAWSA